MGLLFLATCFCVVQLPAAKTDSHCSDEPDCKYCKHGWYGSDCDIPCPTNCDVHSGCHRTYGQCDHMCALNYWGNFCDRPCPPSCREGCNQTTAVCHGGCFAGWYGMFCNSSCRSDCKMCSQITGRCMRFKLTSQVTNEGYHKKGIGQDLRIVFVLLLVLPSFLIVGIVQLISICLDKYKRQKNPAAHAVSSEKTCSVVV